MPAELYDKSSGEVRIVELDAINLDGPTVVKLPLEREDLVGATREGNDLVLRLANGEEIRIADFYAFAEDASEIVLQEADGSLWLVEPDTILAYEPLGQVDDLTQLAAGSTGGAAGPAPSCRSPASSAPPASPRQQPAAVAVAAATTPMPMLTLMQTPTPTPTLTPMQMLTQTRMLTQMRTLTPMPTRSCRPGCPRRRRRRRFR